MNIPKYVLAIDPSGNFFEGSGQTGWCLYDMQNNKIIKFGVLSAKKYKSQFQYWKAHIALIDSLVGFKPDVVVEDYLLYGTRATNQINSRFETPQLIGVIKYECYNRGIHLRLQTAQQVKTRWTDSILEHKGLIKRLGNKYYIQDCALVDHIRDAIRHAVHYSTYGNKEVTHARY